MLLRDIHSKLLDCHQQETASLSLPQLNRLFETSFVWDESSDSNADTVVIPSQLQESYVVSRIYYLLEHSTARQTPCLPSCKGIA